MSQKTLIDGNAKTTKLPFIFRFIVGNLAVFLLNTGLFKRRIVTDESKYE